MMALLEELVRQFSVLDKNDGSRFLDWHISQPPVDPAAELARCFCVWQICPTSRSIASADMKQPCGAKPAKSSSLSKHWIVVSHKREGAVFRADDASTDGFENQRLFALADRLRLLAAHARSTQCSSQILKLIQGRRGISS
jgi:hypothetical protein